MRRQGLFEDLGRDVLAARGDDEFLLTARDTQVSAIVDRGEVAGLEPAVDVGFGRGLGQVVVALRHGDTAHEQLAVGSDLHAVAGPREAHRVRGEVLRSLHGDWAGRLGQAVALEERDTQAPIEVCEVEGQGRATRDDRVQVRAQDRADLRQDQGVGDAAAQLERGGRAGGGHRRGVWDGRRVGTGAGDGGLGQGRVHVGGGLGQGARLLGGPGEHAPLHTAASLRGRSVVDLLHDARNHEEHRRLEGRDVVDEVTGVRRESGDALAREQAVHDEARQDVGDRQEKQRARLRVVDEQGQEVVGLQHRRDEVAVREDDALGHTRRARGVDDRRLVAQLHSVGALAYLLDGDALGGPRQDPLGATVQGENMTHTLGAHGLDQLGLLRRRRDDDAHVGVSEDMGDLLRGIRLVDGDRDRAAGQGGHVDEGPLIRGRGQDRQVVARFEADADEATRDRVGLAEERLHRHAAPRADVGSALDRDLPGVALDALMEHLGQIHVLGGLARGDRLP